MVTNFYQLQKLLKTNEKPIRLIKVNIFIDYVRIPHFADSPEIRVSAYADGARETRVLKQQHYVYLFLRQQPMLQLTLPRPMVYVCLDPLLVDVLQRKFSNFFQQGIHWITKNTLYLPIAGLICRFLFSYKTSVIIYRSIQYWNAFLFHIQLLFQGIGNAKQLSQLNVKFKSLLQKSYPFHNLYSHI